MNKTFSLTLSALGAELLAVTDNCPVAKCATDDCPLCSIAKMPRPKRKAWLGFLKESELEYLATYHRVCTKLNHADKPRRKATKSAKQKRK